MDSEITTSNEWDSDVITGQTGKAVDRYKLPDGLKARLSFSGSERNSVFVQGGDGVYSNLSGISGLDSKKDGRSVGFIDWNRDGRNDVLITNSNSPTLEIYRNQIGEIKSDNHFVAVSVVGGNKKHEPSEWASRDGVGAVIRVQASDAQMIREVRCGEGLATQNSRCYLVGLGDTSSADKVSVRWPNGKTNSIQDVESGTWVTFYENPEETKNQNGFMTTVYSVDLQEKDGPPPSMYPEFPVTVSGKENTFKVVMAMATWCASCKRHIPEVAQIAEKFPGKVELFAIAVDGEDSQEKLDQYVSQYSPSYRLLPSNSQSAFQFTKYVVDELGRGDLPYSVVIAPNGNVVFVGSSLPTVSELKKLICEIEQRTR